MKRLLIQTQLSNYDTQGRFILECDSGWQMCMGRVRQMLKLNPELHIDVMGPVVQDVDGQGQVVTSPWKLNNDLFQSGRLRYIEHRIQPNALETRYDFDMEHIAYALELASHKKREELRYDAVYINDPMHLRNFKAMFLLRGGYRPRFYVHSHFVDSPAAPKFPQEASLWLGQLEAAQKADWNFWQCSSALQEFEREARKVLVPQVVDSIMAKSEPWDDGYSSEEINSPVDMKNVRFSEKEFDRLTDGKIVIFVPNRIGGMGRSSDYTNCGKFMFELLPQLAERRNDFVVIAGNPSQKFLNSELETMCGEHGYVNLVPDALTRDEFKYVTKNADISLGLYDQDTYGGTVARECVELGALPFWLDINEYQTIAREAGGYPLLAKPDWSDFVEKLSFAINAILNDWRGAHRWLLELQKVVRSKCSYEATTEPMMKRMGLL